jgi:hypothetical protein
MTTLPNKLMPESSLLPPKSIFVQTPQKRNLAKTLYTNLNYTGFVNTQTSDLLTPSRDQRF